MFTTLVAHNIPKSMVVLLGLFFCLSFLGDWLDKREKKVKSVRVVYLLVVAAVGLLARLSLAYFFKGNYDVWIWEEAAKIAVRGENIYANLATYKYFPLWIIVLGFLKKIHLLFPQLKFFFILKSFLTLIDFIICYFLFLLAKRYKKSYLKVAAAFFLNPASIIITGFHGQFENIAILFIVLGLYLYKKYKKFYLSWLAFTFGGIAKHMFLNQPLIFLSNVNKKNKFKTSVFFFFSILIGLTTLLPFWREGKDSIIKNLLFYSYTKESYGMSFILSKIKLGFLINTYRYLFIALFFIFPFFINKKRLASALLLGVLFFISFTPGISDQYFVMPLALGALSGSFWFYLYSLFASLYLFGSSAQFNIAIFKIFSDNIIFLIAVFWFVIEYVKSYESKS